VGPPCAGQAAREPQPRVWSPPRFAATLAFLQKGHLNGTDAAVDSPPFVKVFSELVSIFNILIL